MNCQLDDDIYVPVVAPHRESLTSRVRQWFFASLAPKLRAMHLM
ncbi:MAG: hypothetical protein QM783_13435 [Phycisphaerales bacterium]